MRTEKIMAACVVALALLLPVAQAQEKRPAAADEFVLRFPASADTRTMAVNTYRAGDFGGVGEDVKITDARCVIGVKKTRSLKAIVFSPHHQMVLISAPSLQGDSLRSVDIKLKPLRSVPLAGKMILPSDVDGTHAPPDRRALRLRLGHGFHGVHRRYSADLQCHQS